MVCKSRSQMQVFSFSSQHWPMMYIQAWLHTSREFGVVHAKSKEAMNCSNALHYIAVYIRQACEYKKHTYYRALTMVHEQRPGNHHTAKSFLRWSLWVPTVLKYPKKCLEDLTTFFISTWWGDSKIWKKLNSHGGFLSHLQNSKANSAHLAAHFCPALVCPQKATVRIQFLPYFWNPLIK